MADPDVDWETCAEDGCIGACLPSGGKCWAHATDSDLDSALKRLGEHGHVDVRSVLIIPELLGRLLAVAPRDDHGDVILTAARFNRATFHGDARFDRVTFQGGADFEGATFHGDARFDRVTFQRGARFDRVTFHGDAGFHGATFQRGAWFERATFQRNAVFAGTTFHYAAWFGRATFQRDARFGGAAFQRARQLGPMLVRKSLRLDQAVFHERAQIEASAAAVCCKRTRFLAGVQLRLRWAQVVLDDADLAAPSILADAPEFQGLEEGRWARAIERLRISRVHPRGSGPRLLSVRRADVAGLTVAGVDMHACRFAGAHHLDQLSIEEPAFDYVPKGWWAARHTIAEEHHWRALRRPDRHDSMPPAAPSGRADQARWYRPANRPPPWLETEVPNAAQISAVYRSLRRGRENNKHESLAADFYYGEMEMRRHAKRTELHGARRHDHRQIATASEYVVLWLYWLVSGYGLRAWRALTALAVVVLLASGIFAFWGFAPQAEPAIRAVAVNAQGAPTYAPQPVQQPAGLGELPTAIRFSAQATTALLRGPDRPLTPLGEWLDMALRLIGPVLLGLAVLSVRGRVKR
jgi:hypothetical protein